MDNNNIPRSSSIQSQSRLLGIAPENTTSIYTPSFSKSEINSRVKKIREYMHKQKIELLIISSPDNLHYLTGFDGWSFYVPQYAILHIDELHGDPYLVIRHMDSYAGHSTTHINSEHILYYPDYFVDSTEYHPINLVCDLIKNKEWQNCTIGIDMDSDYCRARSVSELTKNLKNIKLVNDNHVINWVRIIKSDFELDYIRKSAKIADLVMYTALQHIGIDITQGEVAGKISNIQSRYGVYTAIAPMIMTNDKAAHMNWEPNYKFRIGDTTNFELAAAYHHYHCPIARTCIIETPTNVNNGLLESMQQIHKGMDKALNIAKVGNTAEDIYNAYNSVMKTVDNVGKQSRVGYSFGIGYPPDWGEKTLSCRPNDKTKLEVGMCLHLIAGCGDGFGYEYSEAIIITEGYPELLCRVPRGLFIKNLQTDNLMYYDKNLELKSFDQELCEIFKNIKIDN